MLQTYVSALDGGYALVGTVEISDHEVKLSEFRGDVLLCHVR